MHIIKIRLSHWIVDLTRDVSFKLCTTIITHSCLGIMMRRMQNCKKWRKKESNKIQ